MRTLCKGADMTPANPQHYLEYDEGQLIGSTARCVLKYLIVLAGLQVGTCHIIATTIECLTLTLSLRSANAATANVVALIPQPGMAYYHSRTHILVQEPYELASLFLIISTTLLISFSAVSRSSISHPSLS